MAFDDVVFPQLACKGVTRVEGLSNFETRGSGTIEVRNSPQQYGGFVWTINSIGQTASVINSATSFIRRRNYNVNSFKFKDPHYPELMDEPLAYYGSSKWYLYLGEYNESGTKVAGVHPIFHPDTSNITITRNGSPVSGTFSIEDGEPLLTISGSSSGDTILVSGPYWLSVRLASEWSWSVITITENGYTDVGPSIGRTANIVLKEVFEY